HGGGGSVTTIDPIVSVNHDLTSSLNAPVLGYTTSSPNPTYLRMTSLDQYSAGAFTARALNADPKARVGNGLGVLSPSEQVVTTKIAVARSFAFRWLPMPTVATAVDVAGDWRYDPVTATAFSASDTTSDLRYTVTSSPNLPSPAQLARDQSTPTGLPPGDLETPNVSPAVRQLTRQVVAGAESKFDAALDIQRFLTGNRFSYTTHPPAAPGDVDSLTYFLTVSRAGFCQQYATAMAVMARLVGIPSRVAVGFTPGTRQADGEWLVTTHDAHAWPELYFSQYGWLPFEPTPRTDGQTVTPTYARAVPNHHGGKHPAKTGIDNPIRKPGAPDRNNGKGSAAGGKSDAATSTTHPSSFAGTWWVVAGALVLLALLAPGSARALTRRRRMIVLRGPRPSPDAAWAELRDSTIDAGGPWSDDRSPRQSAYAIGRWLTASQEVRAALGRLTRAEEEHRYSAGPASPGRSLAPDLRTVRSALRRRRSRGRRLRAVLLPPSTMQRVSTWWSAMADAIPDARPGGLRGRGRRLAR
ncbi:MAG TPA: DUF3488 and transglutaminase-like domain-containing protein, partial [Mycobacteriales bacterium]|nr:DUF3488 and transglutaminase-like domain-containing protein [Mycobacteriales bacterium]